MRRTLTTRLTATVLSLTLLAGCTGAVAADDAPTQVAVAASATPGDTTADDSTADNSTGGDTSDGDALDGAVSGSTDDDSSTGSTSLDAALAELAEAHGVDEVDASDPVEVTLDGTGATSTSGAVTSADGTITLSAGGTYRITGELDGQLVVDADEEKVTLILDGAVITSSAASAIAVTSADEVTVSLAEGSTSSLTATGAADGTDTDIPNAALWSEADLSVTGTGSLTVSGSVDGITSKDGLVVDGGAVTVTAGDDGVRGKDYLVVSGGDLTVTAGGHGLKSDNADDTTVGYVALLGGSVEVTTSGSAAEDGVNAQTILVGATDLTAAAVDDGLHADLALTVDLGTLTVTSSTEGVESAAITLAGGTVDVTASDDAVNATTGGGTAGGMGGGGMGGGMGAVDAGASVTITGGDIMLTSGGDGLDSNGTATMSGGTLVVNGPTSDGNGAIDVPGGFVVTGGTVAAGGSAGMAQAPSADSQGWVSATFNGTVSPGSVVEVVDVDGTVVASYTTVTAIASLVVSDGAIVAGETYTVTVDGTDLGQVVAGEHAGGQRGPGGRP